MRYSLTVSASLAAAAATTVAGLPIRDNNLTWVRMSSRSTSEPGESVWVKEEKMNADIHIV